MNARGRVQDHYEVLGVSPDAPDEVIRAVYRALAAKYHPDRNPGDRDAELKLKRLNDAFRVLGNPETRKQYDELTRAPEAADAPKSEPPSRDQRGAPQAPPPTPTPAPVVDHIIVTRDSRRFYSMLSEGTLPTNG